MRKPVPDCDKTIEENCKHKALEAQQIVLEDATSSPTEKEIYYQNQTEDKSRKLNYAAKEILFTVMLAFFASQASNMAILKFQHIQSVKTLFDLSKTSASGAFGSKKVGYSFTKVPLLYI